MNRSLAYDWCNISKKMQQKETDFSGVCVMMHKHVAILAFESHTYISTLKSRNIITLRTSLILKSGDVSPNSGPAKQPCAVCNKLVASSNRAIQCDNCGKWCHIGPKCGKVKVKDYNSYIEQDNLKWTCPNCRGEMNQGNNKDMFETLKGLIDYEGLKVAHINCRGLKGKIAEITLLLQRCNIDILGITESHLSESVKDEEINMADYAVVRLDRKNKGGGGCLIYYKDNLDIVSKPKFTVRGLESIWIEVISKSQGF